MAVKFDRIQIDPEVCMGQPTIRGLRLTVAFVLKLLASGMTHQEVLEAYPELEKPDLLQAMEYAAWQAAESHRPINVVAR